MIEHICNKFQKKYTALFWIKFGVPKINYYEWFNILFAKTHNSQPSQLELCNVPQWRRSTLHILVGPFTFLITYGTKVDRKNSYVTLKCKLEWHHTSAVLIAMQHLPFHLFPCLFSAYPKHMNKDFKDFRTAYEGEFCLKNITKYYFPNNKNTSSQAVLCKLWTFLFRTVCFSTYKTFLSDLSTNKFYNFCAHWSFLCVHPHVSSSWRSRIDYKCGRSKDFAT